MSTRRRRCEFSHGRQARSRPTGSAIATLPIRLSFPAWRLDSPGARAPTPSNPSNLAYAAYEFREALIPLQGITPRPLRCRSHRVAEQSTRS